jgi:hypothetical protein
MAKTETVDTAQPDEQRGERTYNTPSGHWFKVRDWRELRRGDKRAVLAAIQPGSFTQEYDITNGLLALLVTNWSYDLLPLPKVAAGSLDLLPPEDDAVFTEAVVAARRALFPPKAATDAQQAEQEADPTSPTGGSGE